MEYDLESIVNRMIEYMQNDCKLKKPYKKRIRDFYAYSDQNNCRRVFDRIRQFENGE